MRVEDGPTLGLDVHVTHQSTIQWIIFSVVKEPNEMKNPCTF